MGDANILDVGCGTGLLGELLLENTQNTNVINSIDGMDLTQEMLDILEKERGDLYNEIHQHDIAETPWPFESNKYDLSVCNGVLVYVKDSDCLDEFVRVTKPGGHCLLMLRKDSLDQFGSKIYQLLLIINGKSLKSLIPDLILKHKLIIKINTLYLIIITFFKFYKLILVIIQIEK